MRIFILIPLLFILKTVQAADPYPRNESIDIRHYVFRLELNDTTDRIAGETAITIRFKKSISEFELDLSGINNQNKGMSVKNISLDGQSLKFTHVNDRIKIQYEFASGDERTLVVRYEGIPQDGLIIGKNRFGDRTFFGDNWPNRAHHWLPTIDHPYDKATCEFIVTAPEHYTVIATGTRKAESAVEKKRKTTHWKTAVTLPTKVMVIGVARFAIAYLGSVNGTPVQSWVYPQNRFEGFSDYAIATKILDYLSKNIAVYPYEKLANVQSTTIYGGMENAGNIFYYEKSVTGQGKIEGLMAHEIAHQWFGDSASEADWYHVWLSEGFATYFTQLYLEFTYGRDRLMEEMKVDRQQVLDYFVKSPAPIVNPSITDIRKVLSINSYQKASWVLHMLRYEIGDQKFREGVRQYYQQYQLGNAMTDDFRLVMEKISGKDLQIFFDQWIFKAGQPDLAVTWQYDDRKKNIRVVVEQKQKNLFDFPLEIGLNQVSGAPATEKVRVTAIKQEFAIPSAQKPVSLSLDPNVWLLFTGKVTEKGK
ncbi:MAG TPA: M1 family metallopeptidase [Cyclobacteriaceae bacterium]|nr:M1 family metallopeptidase [Cyclobacteriaceae bacterium]